MQHCSIPITNKDAGSTGTESTQTASSRAQTTEPLEEPSSSARTCACEIAERCRHTVSAAGECRVDLEGQSVQTVEGVVLDAGLPQVLAEDQRGEREGCHSCAWGHRRGRWAGSSGLGLRRGWSGVLLIFNAVLYIYNSEITICYQIFYDIGCIN